MQSSGPEQQPGQDKRSARRRLIRGAFAAPAALTLYSGSALAASSSCVAREVERGDPNPPPSNSPTGDVYLRVQQRAKGSGTTASTWVSGADLLLAATTPEVIAMPNQSFLGIDKWYCMTAGVDSQYAMDMVYTNADATDTNKLGVPQPNGNYVAIRVDSNGLIVGVTGTAKASAVTRSCWTSFVKMR